MSERVTRVRDHVIDRGLFYDSGGGSMCEVCGRQGRELDEPCESAEVGFAVPPGWAVEDCCCCAGIAWGGEYPNECDHCNGAGNIWLHEATGLLAEYPGGRFVGRRSSKDKPTT